MRSLLSISKTRRPRGLRGAGPAERRGATLVEFALVSPILFVFMCCCFEFGRIAMMRASIANAAYEGARRASVPGSRADQAIQSATDVVSASGISSSTVTVNPTVFDASTRDVTVTVSVVSQSADVKSITVAVAFPYKLIAAWPGFSDQISLSHSVTMTQFR